MSLQRSLPDGSALPSPWGQGVWVGVGDAGGQASPGAGPGGAGRGQQGAHLPLKELQSCILRAAGIGKFQGLVFTWFGLVFVLMVGLIFMLAAS